MKILSVICLFTSAVALSSCNTIGGMGRDVEQLGSKVNEAAQETSRAINN